MLTTLGEAMLGDLHLRHQRDQGKLTTKEDKALLREKEGTFERRYQEWYSEASAMIRQLLPDRHAEFVELYRSDSRRKSINLETFSIQDWLKGMRLAADPVTGQKLYDEFAGVTMRLQTQVEILKSASRRFDSSLFEIRQLVQADLFDSELEAAASLAKHGFFRAAGAVAGVVLEKHLAEVASNHGITMRKKHPGISDWNDALKEGSVLDVPACENPTPHRHPKSLRSQS